MIFELFLIMILPLFVKAFDCNFKFHKIDEEIHYSINSTIILSCVPKYDNDYEVCKSMSAQFIWVHKNKTLIAEENRRRFDPQSQRLIIFYAQSSDGGKYICDSENKDGPINRTFVLSLIEAGPLHSTIAENIIPRRERDEKKDRIYWLPEMLLNDRQQNIVKNSLDEQRYEESYYLSVAPNDHISFRVQWYFQFEDSENRTLVEGDRYRQLVTNRPCHSEVLLARPVSGLCYFSALIVPELNYANQGLYHSVSTLSIGGQVTDSRTLTYSLRINRAKIDKPHNPLDGDSHMTFNLNSKVCQNDYFDFNCSVSPDGNYYTVINKVLSNSNQTLIAETEMEQINITGSDGQVISNGNVVQRSGITYRISTVSFSDAGLYVCTSIPINQMTSIERRFFELKMQMELIVQVCSGKSLVSYSASRSATWHTVLLWPLIAISSVTVVLILWIGCYHYYFQSYLVKTVIFQHPNKLYVPHDTYSPLVLPQVSIKTSHRFCLQRDKPGSQQKPPSRKSTVTPLSEKLAKYFQKSCIFNYRRVDASGSSPIVDIIGLSNPDSSKSSSNDTREDSQSRDIILQNNSRTQYRLPSNIGWVFSKDSLIIGSKIGEGAFGIVYDGIAKAMSTRRPIDVAVKTLHDSFGDEDLINLVKEMEIMKLIGHHRHIIGLYGAYVDNGHPYMVMELAKNGNLRDFLRVRRNQTNPLNIRECPSSITLYELLRFSLEIASGMEFLASKMIIHRDLAARNILVDQCIEMKIADFGLTRAVENYYRKSTDGRLPIKWMAPECLLDRVYTVKSDVWSFGIVLWEIFTMGQTPYPTVQPDSMHQALRTGLRNDKPPLASDEMYTIMLTIWNDDPIERPSFEELTRKLYQIKVSEQMSLMQDPVGHCAQSLDHNIDHSQRALVKDYLEISSNQCYTTTNV